MASTAIESVEVEILADPHNPQLLVHLRCADGVTGTGETWWGTFQPSAEPGTPVLAIAVLIDTLLAPIVVGAPCAGVGDIEALWQRMFRSTLQYGHEGIVSTAMSGIDIALWDAVAKRRSLPVADLLGSRRRDPVPAYASLTWLGDVDRVCTDARRALDAGFRAVKLHEADPALIVEVRRRLGREATLMVDASARFDEAGAHGAVRALAEADLTWFEEPVFPQTDHAALARVRSSARIPIAAGENEFSVAALERLVMSGAVDLLQPEVAKMGGLTPARELAAVSRRTGVPLCPHNYSLGPSLLANIHWAATTPEVQWLEVPWLPEGGSFPCGMDLPELVDGCVRVPDAPGLGFSAPAAQRP